MKRLCIFGGSFNPIHLGHIGIARSVLDNGLSDKILLMVSPQNPWKKQQDLAPETDRLRLAQMAVEQEPGIEVSDFEFHLKRPSFTWITLDALHKKCPDYRLQLLIGSDNWKSFDHWAHYEEILSEVEIIVYPRGKESLPKVAWENKAHLSVIQSALFPWSSTEIRNAIHRGEDVKRMLPKEIVNEVKKIYQ